MKRRLFQLAVFLLLGAVLNVAVAWGIALTLSPTHIDPSLEESEADLGEWLDHFDQAWDGIYVEGSGYSGVGHRIRSTIIYRASGPLDIRRGATVQDVRTGWPALSLHGAMLRKDQNDFPIPPELDLPLAIKSRFFYSALTPRMPRLLPLRPKWMPFAINTIVYATLLWLLIAGPLLLREVRRFRRGCCPACGYDLRHAEHDACPECGAAIPSPLRERARVKCSARSGHTGP